MRVANNDSGVLEIVSGLKGRAPIDYLTGFDLEKTLPLIAKRAPDEGVGILVDLLGRDLKESDRHPLELAPLFADPTILDALLSVLDRRLNRSSRAGLDRAKLKARALQEARER